MVTRAIVLIGALITSAACDTSRPIRHRPDSGCVDQAHQVVIDSTCEGLQCEGTIAGSSCEATIRFSGCATYELRTSRNAAGEMIFAPSAAGSCESKTGPSGSLFSIECMQGARVCRYDLYESWPPLDLSVITKAVLDVPLSEPVLWPEDALGGLQAYYGWVSSVAAYGDRIVVASFAGEQGSLFCRQPAPHTRFYLFDQETFELIDRVDGPPCVQRVAADPKGDGFLAVFGVATSSIARFDRGARMVGSGVAIAHPEPEDERHGVALSTSDDWVHVLSGRQFDGAFSRFYVLDPNTLATRSVSMTVEGKARSGIDLGPRGFAMADSILDTILFFDRATAVGNPGIALFAVRPVSPEAGLLAKAGDDLYLSTTGAGGAAWIISDLEDMTPKMAPILFYERASIPWAALEWPHDRSKMLVGLVDHEEGGSARVAFLSPHEQRFLPGSQVIGEGAVSEMIADRAGRVWALMPWSGKLARITP